MEPKKTTDGLASAVVRCEKEKAGFSYELTRYLHDQSDTRLFDGLSYDDKRLGLQNYVRLLCLATLLNKHRAAPSFNSWGATAVLNQESPENPPRLRWSADQQALLRKRIKDEKLPANQRPLYLAALINPSGGPAATLKWLQQWPDGPLRLAAARDILTAIRLPAEDDSGLRIKAIAKVRQWAAGEVWAQYKKQRTSFRPDDKFIRFMVDEFDVFGQRLADSVQEAVSQNHPPETADVWILSQVAPSSERVLSWSKVAEWTRSANPAVAQAAARALLWTVNSPNAYQLSVPPEMTSVALQFLRHDDPRDRLLGLRVLRFWTPGEGQKITWVSEVLPLAHDADPAVRSEALECLGSAASQDPHAAGQYLERMTKKTYGFAPPVRDPSSCGTAQATLLRQSQIRAYEEALLSGRSDADADQAAKTLEQPSPALGNDEPERAQRLHDAILKAGQLSDDNVSAGFTIDGKRASKLEFQKAVAALTEISESRISKTGTNEKGKRYWDTRYQAKDSAGNVWSVQEYSTSAGVIESVLRRMDKPK